MIAQERGRKKIDMPKKRAVNVMPEKGAEILYAQKRSRKKIAQEVAEKIDDGPRRGHGK